MNIGVIGTGNIALAHLMSLKEIQTNQILEKKYGKSILIKALIDSDEKKIRKLADKRAFGAEIYSSNPKDLLADDSIDLVYITTPTKFHSELFQKVTETGKHVFIEKPLAFNLPEIKEMITLQQRHSIHVQIGLVLRHCPVFWKLKGLMEEEDLGKPLATIFRDDQEWPVQSFLHSSTWRKDASLARAGCLFEHSIHDVDLIEYFFAPNLKQLYASIHYVSDLTNGQLEDSAVLQFKYEPDLPVSLISLWHKVARDQRRIEMFFEHAYILLDDYEILTFGKFKYQVKRRKKSILMSKLKEEYAKALDIPEILPNFGPYFYENLSFLESIIKDEEPYPGLDLGYRAHELIETAYDSARKNRIIEF